MWRIDGGQLLDAVNGAPRCRPVSSRGSRPGSPPRGAADAERSDPCRNGVVVVGLPRSPVAGRYAPTVELDELQRNWDELGKVDPLWAILTDPDKRGQPVGRRRVLRIRQGERRGGRRAPRRARAVGARFGARLRVRSGSSHPGLRRPLRRGVGRRHRAVDDRSRRVVEPPRLAGALRGERPPRSRVLRRRHVRPRLLRHRAPAHPSRARTRLRARVLPDLPPRGSRRLPAAVAPRAGGLARRRVRGRDHGGGPAPGVGAPDGHGPRARAEHQLGGVALPARGAPGRQSLARRRRRGRRARQRSRAHPDRGPAGRHGRRDAARPRAGDTGGLRAAARRRARGDRVVRRPRIGRAGHTGAGGRRAGARARRARPIPECARLRGGGRRAGDGDARRRRATTCWP